MEWDYETSTVKRVSLSKGEMEPGELNPLMIPVLVNLKRDNLPRKRAEILQVTKFIKIICTDGEFQAYT